MDGLVIGFIAGIVIIVVGGIVIGKLKAHKSSVSYARPMPANETGYGAQVAVRDDISSTERHFGDENIILPDIFALEVGAYIIDGISKEHILGRVDYEQDGDTWVEYYLTDTTWLGADKDEGDRLINWQRVVPGDLVPNGNKALVFKGVTYEYVERGKATYHAEGRVGDLTGTGKVVYYDYATSDGANHLSFERYDGSDDWEVAIGETVVISTLDYYPPGQHVPDAEQR